MNSSKKITEEQCKKLGRELGDYLTGKTEIHEIYFIGLISWATQLKDDHELFSVFINSTGCQALAELLEQKYPDNVIVQLIVVAIREHEKSN